MTKVKWSHPGGGGEVGKGSGEVDWEGRTVPPRKASGGSVCDYCPLVVSINSHIVSWNSKHCVLLLNRPHCNLLIYLLRSLLSHHEFLDGLGFIHLWISSIKYGSLNSMGSQQMFVDLDLNYWKKEAPLAFVLPDDRTGSGWLWTANFSVTYSITFCIYISTWIIKLFVKNKWDNFVKCLAHCLEHNKCSIKVFCYHYYYQVALLKVMF